MALFSRMSRGRRLPQLGVRRKPYGFRKVRNLGSRASVVLIESATVSTSSTPHAARPRAIGGVMRIEPTMIGTLSARSTSRPGIELVTKPAVVSHEGCPPHIATNLTGAAAELGSRDHNAVQTNWKDALVDFPIR